jgi:hypothetical protein
MRESQRRTSSELASCLTSKLPQNSTDFELECSFRENHDNSRSHMRIGDFASRQRIADCHRRSHLTTYEKTIVANIALKK